MSRFRFLRRIAIATTLGIVVAGVALPTFAESPITVQFQPNNPWTQEVGSVDRSYSSHDYSVSVAAGKTLQINLVTRNPNVFFKVTNETQGKQLLDSYQTGATTWSTQNPTASTYTIRVYAVPETLERGKKAEYALQVGQYGAEDMQVATTTVTFQDNNPWVQQVGTLEADATSHDYTVAVAAGNTFKVNLVTRDPGLHFKVEDPASHTVLVDTASTGAATWSTPVATATTYTIDVYADPASLPPGKSAHYALQIGQYGSQGAQSAASAAAPALPGGVPVSASTAAH